MNAVIAAIEHNAIMAAESTFLATHMLPFRKRVEASIAAYELAMVRPIAEVPSGVPVLTLDPSVGNCAWCEDFWDPNGPPNGNWSVCSDSAPTHFRPLPPITPFCPVAKEIAHGD